ncbi:MULTISPECIES: DUF5305 domain-containing protein [Halobacterium]|uniref:DUF5305 domain-containing protein n=1 Tax=Halobacterium TaxID=2239 RepID=UPI00073EEB83|nr:MULTISPECIES: DUF5305 domain-containing protein [Halobacterium]MCG1004311.1 DUF5305 domain-containing protein [Halobacterium noricense]
MGEGSRWLRVRAVVSSWFPVLVAALAVLAVAGGWAAYTAHAAPGTTQEQSEQLHWRVSGEFQHAAEITRENPIFDVGTTLSNRSTYFTDASPILDGRYVATYSGLDAPAASVDLDAALVVRAVGGDSENTVYWTDRTPLDGTSADVQSAESASVAFSLNASRLAQRQSEIQASLGQTPGTVEAFVAVDATTEGSVEGQPASLSLSHRLPVSVDGDTYTVGPAATGSEAMTTTETVTVSKEYGPLWSVGGPLLFVGGVAGLAVLGVGRDRNEFALSADERDLLAFRDERAEFDEWVVRATLPEEVHDRPRATAASLSDVVDFAIDSDTAVVEDPDSGTFYAITDQLLVAYEPPALAGTPEPDDDADLGAFEGIEPVDTSENGADRSADDADALDESDDREDTPQPQD